MMNKVSLGSLIVLLGVFLLIGPACQDLGWAPVTDVLPDLPQGGHLFTQHCAACHGATGRGNGPAAIALDVRPRDFRSEPFRYISTINGVATQEDLRQTIRSGRHFGAMPSGPDLTDKEVHILADYVRAINRLGLMESLSEALAEEGEEMTLEELEEIVEERAAPGDPITIVRPGVAFRANTEAGRPLYMARCASCHGPTGRGDGLDLPLDEQGRPIKVRDLTSGRFRGGFAAEEIFKRVRCGIPGTPMPTQEGMTNEEIWQIVYYVRFLSGRRR